MRIHKKKCIYAILTLLCICSLSTEYLYYHRPLIPFEVIAPYITWRTYENDVLYKQSISNRPHFKNQVKSQLKYQQCVLLQNDYPYHVNGKHYVLWCNKRVNVDEVLKNHFNDTYIIKWFENPRNLKSIPEIQHYHVFVKTKVK